MLEGDTDIDWGAAYSALELIEHDLRDRSVDGHALGWWTNQERDNFRATANSAEALGVAARHGTGGVPVPRMSSKDASWYVRRVTAYWLTCILQAES
jgi:DNA-binding transcriptional LysR family regulator